MPASRDASLLPARQDVQPSPVPTSHLDVPTPLLPTVLLTFACQLCQAVFTQVGTLNRHVASKHGTQTFPCPTCGKSFARKDHLTSHLKSCTSKRSTDDQPDKPTKKPRVEPAGPSNSTSLMAFVCTLCGAAFNIAVRLTEHMTTQHADTSVQVPTCCKCQKTFSCKKSVTRHLKTCGTRPTLYTCPSCPKTFASATLRDAHAQTHVAKKQFQLNQFGDPTPSVDPSHPPSAAQPPSSCQTALGRSLLQYRYDGTAEDIGLLQFLRGQNHKELLEDAVKEHKGVKFYVSANVKLRRPTNWLTRGEQEAFPYFTSKCAIVLGVTDIDLLLSRAYAKMEADLDKWLREGSGWIVDHINFAEIVIIPYKPL